MKRLGTYLMIFGVGSMLLSFMHREFTILMWIDIWGPTVGWAIRISMVVAGLALFLKARATAIDSA